MTCEHVTNGALTHNAPATIYDRHCTCRRVWTIALCDQHAGWAVVCECGKRI